MEVDPGEEISEELLEDGLDKIHKPSICAKHGLRCITKGSLRTFYKKGIIAST